MPSGPWSDFKELVRTRTDLVQLVSERVALQSRRGGREFVGLCPFHDDHDPSLRVDPERQSYKCWACGEGGDCFAFVQKIENVGFREALELLATRANLEMPRISGNGAAENSDGRPTRREMFDVLTWAEGEYHACLRTSAEGKAAREYLQSRGFSTETIERFRLGFSPEDGQFLQRRSRGRFNVERLAAVRLVLERTGGGGFYDYFRGRVMFPIRDASARNVAFGGRALPGTAGESGPKYINSSDSPLFSKSRILFALDIARPAIVERDLAVVMEGYADCIMAHQHGITNAVATLGTALTEQHVLALKRFTRKVVLVFDGDEAGRKAAEKSLPQFLSQDVDLRILTLTEEKDPADFLSLRGGEAFVSLLESAREAWEYKLSLCIERTGLDSIDARVQVVDEMIELLRQAPRFAGSEREHIILNRLAFRVGLSEEVVRKRRSSRHSAAHTGKGTKGDSASAARQSGMPASGDAKLEAELLEIILSNPEGAAGLRGAIAAADFRHEEYRRVLELCFQLLEEGASPSFEKLMTAAEDPGLKRLLVTLDASAREKESTRARGWGSSAPSWAERQAFLVNSLRRRRRFEEHAMSRGELATRPWASDRSDQTATSGIPAQAGMPVQSGVSGMLDPSQMEGLRRAKEIHGERANARTST